MCIKVFWNVPWLVYPPVVLWLLLYHGGGVESVTHWAAKLKIGHLQEFVGSWAGTATFGGGEGIPGPGEPGSPLRSPRSPAAAMTSHQVAL